MDFVAEVVAWLADPAHWQSSNGVPVRTWEHLWYSGLATGAAVAIGLPIGLLIGHTGKGGAVAINVANVGRSLPTLGILIAMVMLFGLGIGPVIIALVAFAIPPVLTNAYAGIRSVDPEVREAAEGLGMRGLEVLVRVEAPIALPLIMAGIRTAAVQVIATATIAAVGPFGGYGRYIINGLAVRDFSQVLVGALLVAALAIAVEGTLGGLQRLVVPRGLAAQNAEAAAAAKTMSAGP